MSLQYWLHRHRRHGPIIAPRQIPYLRPEIVGREKRRPETRGSVSLGSDHGYILRPPHGSMVLPKLRKPVALNPEVCLRIWTGKRGGGRLCHIHAGPDTPVSGPATLNVDLLSDAQCDGNKPMVGAAGSAGGDFQGLNTFQGMSVPVWTSKVCIVERCSETCLP